MGLFKEKDKTEEFDSDFVQGEPKQKVDEVTYGDMWGKTIKKVTESFEATNLFINEMLKKEDHTKNDLKSIRKEIGKWEEIGNKVIEIYNSDPEDKINITMWSKAMNIIEAVFDPLEELDEILSISLYIDEAQAGDRDAQIEYQHGFILRYRRHKRSFFYSTDLDARDKLVTEINKDHSKLKTHYKKELAYIRSTKDEVSTVEYNKILEDFELGYDFFKTHIFKIK